MAVNGLTLQDVAQIQADAHKAVTRQFRDAAEDNGWTPTETPDAQSMADAFKTATEADDTQHVTGTPSDDRSIADLRQEAKDLGISAAGSKADLAARIDEAKSSDSKSNSEGDK